MLIALVVLLILGCRPKYHLIPANNYNAYLDSFYYPRDTLNFHQVILEPWVIASIDTIIDHIPTEENVYWILEFEKKTCKYYLTQFYVEQYMFNVDLYELHYKCALVKGVKILILDEKFWMPVKESLPYVRIFNPQKLKVFGKRGRSMSWFFEKEKDLSVATFVEKKLH